MGQISELLELVPEERKTWLLDHKLGRDEARWRLQVESLDRFSREENQMRLCFLPSHGGEFLHWFVTDGRWCFGFMQLEEDDEAAPSESATPPLDAPVVHVRQLDPDCDFVVRERFTLTPEVRHRMAQVSGGVNHSLCLRNSEHLAKYIYCGSWMSLQMNEGSLIRKTFESQLKDRARLINCLPVDLAPAHDRRRPVLFEELDSCPSWVCQFESNAKTLGRVEAQAWNVVFLGPTGSGKSRIINMLFNQEVCASAAAGSSITRHCEILQGKWRGKKTNIIDTVGLCNSEAAPDAILTLIKDMVKHNILQIDVVVFVCSERIAEGHQKALKEFLKWMEYTPERRPRFVFLYNKADTISNEAEKQRCLADMGRLLDVDISFQCKWLQPDRSFSSLPCAHASAFPPNATYEDIKADRDILMGQVFGIRKIPNCPRIQVSSESCNIL